MNIKLTITYETMNGGGLVMPVQRWRTSEAPSWVSFWSDLSVKRLSACQRAARPQSVRALTFPRIPASLKMKHGEFFLML